MIIFLALALLAVFLTGIGQVLMKIGARNENDSTTFLAEYLNIYTISAYTILIIVTVISVIALLEIPLKLFYAIASLNFVVIVMLSWLFLKEEVNKGIAVGVVLIMLGIMVFNL